MAVYVDPLMNWGWKIRGRTVANCHLFTDSVDLQGLHELAQAIGMKRSWFQVNKTAPHYDLTPSRREHAVSLGAIEVDRREAVAIWAMRNAKIKALTVPNQPSTSGEGGP